MNEMLKTILNHRSVRSFSEKPVDGQAVQEIIEAGSMGPPVQDSRHSVLFR